MYKTCNEKAILVYDKNTPSYFFLYLYRLLHCKIKFISYKYGYYCTKIKWGYFYKIYVRFMCSWKFM